MIENDIINQSFKALQDAEPVNGGGFIVSKVILVSSSDSLALARQSLLCR